MEIRTKVINGNKWQFVNESWSTSNAWGHKTNVFKNGLEIEEHKSRYYNRTWESYTYQHCMRYLLGTILEDNLKSYITQYKEKNDITRLTSLQKDMIKAEWQEKEYTQELMEIKERINDRRFD